MDSLGPEQLGLTQRRVMISGPLEPGTVAEACSLLMYLDGCSSDPLTVVINSPGGPLGDAMPLADTLDLLRAPFTIDVLGRAHGSAGVVVAAAAGSRRIGRSASISLQLDRRTATPMATARDLTHIAAFDADIEATAAAAVASRIAAADSSTVTLDWVQNQFTRGAPFGAAEALKIGLVDHAR